MPILQLSAWQLATLFLPALINLWAIYHAYARKFPTDQERLLWLGLSVAIPVLGGIIYLIFGRPRGIKC